MVTGDAVERGKPYPEPYLKAAADCSGGPGDCLAIEDSNTGATVGRGGGLRGAVVPNHVPVLDGERRVFADALVGLSAANFRSWTTRSQARASQRRVIS